MCKPFFNFKTSFIFIIFLFVVFFLSFFLFFLILSEKFLSSTLSEK